MKLMTAELIAFIAAINLLEAGLRTSNLAYSEEGIIALGLGFVLMLAVLALEIAAALPEEYPIHQSSFKELAP
ncbi:MULTISPECIES: hypothetical protein [Pseudomonas syringae group]|uniref:Uncharacterized protein n=2 Tax=Pseudomonas syringae group genomosp. 3 TaxID=251701 RepID=A0A3M6BCK0_PSEYM|nr:MULTISPECIES: hypothetical protein [Pseudomonas syringae group]EGH99900.1 hypothetical protein PLA106_27771 [Pseudomonas amygdali pv. lachrymans str. M302278]MBM0212815.1 hypothetical protein [Pseudomonas syringae pv. maculicola]RMM14636.1 hypothetical protein ALQ85_102391 [Pseudomonas syringae]RMM84517.1 hypothetical protein ALQ72_03453 [Pseudomonas syringae pv. maculicola]RMV28694.1 hypothetical protein ALP13_02383 [Pseudomonas syringae pv. maculicola]